jgi:hypothetical protein
MAKKVDWGDVAFAVVAGVAAGTLVPLGAVAIGLPPKFVGPLVGALTAPLIVLLYQWRQRRRQGA